MNPPDPPDPTAVAILHQAAPQPVRDGIVKDPKPGGYQDSGADIAFALRQAGVTVVTPEASPDPAGDIGWTFPDTESGITEAVQAGANILWANTVLFCSHPIERWLGCVRVVGQLPATVEKYDDKAVMNRELLAAGLPVVPHILVTTSPDRPEALLLASLDESALARLDFSFPLVVKPIRGRGSAGVTMVDDLHTLRATVEPTIASARFGPVLMIEPYLAGEEVTVTVMPPDPSGSSPAYRCLPPVRRFNHHDGIAPYNGTVAVVHNSEVLSADEQAASGVRNLLDACRQVAEHIEARAPIRIDCRQDASGSFRIFDVNLKPNMTGPGRPGRDDQLSLTGMAAASIGMDYVDLVMAMLRGARR